MLKRILDNLIGPRVPSAEPPRRWWRYAIPTVLFILAGATLIASYQQPYWNMTLHAPQYPKGLHVEAYLNRLEGDVREIDGLNHYIGMRPLNEAAQLERKTSHILIGSLAMLTLAAIFVHTKWVVLLALPVVLFPAGFLGDLWFWLHNFGQNLDPTAALSSSVKPFTPPVWGEGKVGNFKTVADVDVGWWMAVAASCMVIVGLYFHRRAYKPLVERVRKSRNHERESAKRVPAAPSLIVCMCAIIVPTLGGFAQSPNSFNLHQAVADAEHGSTITVPKGVYPGPLHINKPLSLIADDGAIIDAGGEGDVVTITAPDVTFRGFTVRGSGANLNREDTGILVNLSPRTIIENNIVEDCLFGINFKESPDSIMRGNTIIGKDIYIARRGDGIKLWNSHNSLIENNRVKDIRDAVLWYSDNVVIRGNHVTGSRYGLHFMYSHNNILEENVLEQNSVGVFLMYSRNLILRRNVLARNRGPSGYGIGVKDMQGMIVEDNLMVGNRVGVYIDNPPVYLPEYDRFTRNVFASNDVGMVFQPSVQRVAVFENSFIENLQQVALAGGGELRRNEFTHNGRGNFWSDYRGYDLDGDGIGDMPYQAESLWDNLMDREPGLRLFLFSPAQQAVELASQAFPVVRPRPLMTDNAPLMRPVRADIPAADPPPAWRTWVVALALLGIAALALTFARPLAASRLSKGDHT
jgi:nitrous oxidase accessory protein